MPNTNLHVRIISPQELILDTQADSVSSKNASGAFDILPEHANFITMIENSPIIIKPARNASQPASQAERGGQGASVAGGGRFIGGHPTSDMLGNLPNSHTRVIFTFDDNSKLYFNDQRRFGWVKLVETDKLDLGNLGPEPLEKDFTWQILKTNLLKHKSQPIKVAILDQASVSGIGNIYASEACFQAGIDPRRKVSTLTDKEFKKLHQGVIKSLKDGIKYGGATKTHFVDSEGRKGYFLDYAYVYGKDKKPCKVCGSEIKKIQLGGRGTFFCPACQG